MQRGVITLYSEYYTQAFCLTTALATVADDAAAEKLVAQLSMADYEPEPEPAAELPAEDAAAVCAEILMGVDEARVRGRHIARRRRAAVTGGRSRVPRTAASRR